MKLDLKFFFFNFEDLQQIKGRDRYLAIYKNRTSGSRLSTPVDETVRKTRMRLAASRHRSSSKHDHITVRHVK